MAKLPDIRRTVSKSFVAHAYECEMVYDNVDHELQTAFSKFVPALESAIERAVRASSPTVR